MTSLQEAFDPDQFRQSAHQVVDFLADMLGDSQSGTQEKVLPWADPQSALEEIQRWAAEARPDSSSDLANGLAGDRALQLFQKTFSRSIRLHHPHFMGHQISPTLPVASLAGFVSDYLNNGMGVYEMGIAGTTMERFVVQAAARQFGMGDGADGFLTSGGTLGNLTAMLAARSIKAPGDVWVDGNQQLLAVLVSDQAHYCIDRAARVMGWGKDGVILVPTDAAFKMRTDQLDSCLEQAATNGRKVIAVVGSACSTATGSFDDLVAIGEFCRHNDLWFHVDGAHGAAASFSSKYKRRVAGIELADSVTMDFHKMLLTPALATALVFKEAKHSQCAFTQQADYLWDEESGSRSGNTEYYDLARRTFECTKTMTSLKVFSILAIHGAEIFDANVTRLFDLSQSFASLLETADDFELALQPKANIVCYRYVPEHLKTIDDEQDSAENEVAVDDLNRRLRTKLAADGKFYIVQTKLNGRHWLRSTISNPLTDDEHFLALLQEIRDVANELVN